MLGQNTENEIGIHGNSKLPTLVGVLFVIAALAGFMLYTKSLSTEVSQMKADIDAKSNEITTLEAQTVNFKAAESKLGLSTEVERLEILKAVPTALYQDEVIRDLMELSESYDVKLNSISFSKGSSSQEGVGSLRINSSFQGNYADLTRFLNGIEENARVFKVSTISVQISRLDITDIERVSFSLTIEAFFQQK